MKFLSPGGQKLQDEQQRQADIHTDIQTDALGLLAAFASVKYSKISNC